MPEIRSFFFNSVKLIRNSMPIYTNISFDYLSLYLLPEIIAIGTPRFFPEKSGFQAQNQLLKPIFGPNLFHYIQMNTFRLKKYEIFSESSNAEKLRLFVVWKNHQFCAVSVNFTTCTEPNQYFAG